MEVGTLAHSVFLQNRTQFESSGSKGVLRVIRKTVGLPKGRNLYGNGVTIVPVRNNLLNFVYGRPNSLRKGSVTFNLICFQNSYSTGSTNLFYKENNVRLKLQSLSYRMSKYPNEVVDRNLIQILCKPEFLRMFYQKMNINLGSSNLAPGLKSEIISGQFFKTIGDDIKNESFQFYRSQPHPGQCRGPRTMGLRFVPSKISNSKASACANAARGEKMHLTNKPLTLSGGLGLKGGSATQRSAEEFLKNKIVLEAVKLILEIVFYYPKAPKAQKAPKVWDGAPSTSLPLCKNSFLFNSVGRAAYASERRLSELALIFNSTSFKGGKEISKGKKGL